MYVCYFTRGYIPIKSHHIPLNLENKVIYPSKMVIFQFANCKRLPGRVTISHFSGASAASEDDVAALALAGHDAMTAKHLGGDFCWKPRRSHGKSMTKCSFHQGKWVISPGFRVDWKAKLVNIATINRQLMVDTVYLYIYLWYFIVRWGCQLITN